MRNKTLSVVLTLSFATALALFGTVQAAAFLAGKGTVSGMVTGEDNKPVVGLALRLEQQIPMTAGSRGGSGKKGKTNYGDGGANDLQSSKERVKVVAKGVTDAQGKFSWPNIEEGLYTLVGGSKNVGWIYHEVNVVANQEVKLDDLKLVKVK